MGWKCLTDKDTHLIYFAFNTMSQELMISMLNRASNGNELLQILDSFTDESVDETDTESAES